MKGSTCDLNVNLWVYLLFIYRVIQKKRNTFKIATIQNWDNAEIWGETKLKEKTWNDKITKNQDQISISTCVMLFSMQ